MTTLDTRIPDAARDNFTLVRPAADDDRPADPLKPTLVAYRVPATLTNRVEALPIVAAPADDDGEIFRAGQRVPPGCYQEVDGTRCIEFGEEEVLPASNSGRRTFYRKIERSWSAMLHTLRTPTPAPTYNG